MFRVSGEAPESFFSGAGRAAAPTRRLRVASRRPAGAPPVDVAEAEDFLRLFHAENRDSGSLQYRIDRMRYEVETVGTYRHTEAELAFGARVAWRNSARCIGRLYWKSLKVRDLRDVHTVADIAGHCVQHLRQATNGGKIRPVISIFPPDTPSRPAPRIWNEQLIRYAGYERRDGSVLGDPRYRGFTAAVRSFGWHPPREPGAFDVLPLVVETAEEGAHMFALPRDAISEVPLRHPDLRWFGALGLRWHAVPVISNMRLSIGGVSYPAAPFNGWYMGTEIGARNLADPGRYDLLPVVAERLGLDTSRPDALWKDRALVELTRAVQHSFHEAGVTITDHHTESERFLTHVRREEAAGRKCPADWSWIVPPMSGGQTPVFHRYYDTEPQLPDFFTDEDATRRALHGGPPHFS
ncbi:nitric-oxide synthase [Saccharopolyspora erythraea NRRL 2338]|uniref:Nitric oxide synthase oxygenase n=1 Tax=Saccharopolyspora erythraea TaxID=1836 RepID=A0ABN1C8E4_SACER|nr:nitric oxide synthase oxygenase [Saccharopolyspora erythraea D]PFG98666.1 nitric-oxide synthase [Saccharopolyspora erythraea NRRL 2338]